MPRYKVEYIYTEEQKSKWYESNKKLDAWSLAKELEALLLEYEEKGYKVFSIEPIITTERTAHGPSTKTDGLMVVFEKDNSIRFKF